MMPAKKQIIILFIITFVLKIALGIYLAHLFVCGHSPADSFGQIAVNGGDTFSYFGVMDSLVEEGEYYFWNGERKVYAGRMPYYGSLYFFLRLLVSKSLACDIYVVIQMLFNSLTTILFARLCFEISPGKAVFWLGYLLYFGSFNYFFSSVALNTESFSLSFLIIFLYFFQRFRITEKWSYAIAASVFLAFITALKPYLVLLYPTFFLAVLCCKKSFNFSDVPAYFRRTLVLSLPLLILLAPWIARNAIVLGEFIPAQENIYAGYNFSKSFVASVNFSGAWGGGERAWDPNDAGCYFSLSQSYRCRFQIPSHALTEKYNLEDIERARQNFFKLQENYSPELDEAVAAEFDRLTEIYKQEKPFMYYVGSKFLFFKGLFWHRGNFNLPIHPSFKCYEPYQLSFKVVQGIIYILTITLGAFGLVKLFRARKISFFFLAAPLIITILFVELRTSEIRYVNPVYLMLLVGLPFALINLFAVLKLKYYKLRSQTDDSP